MDVNKNRDEPDRSKINLDDQYIAYWSKLGKNRIEIRLAVNNAGKSPEAVSTNKNRKGDMKN